MTRPHIWYAAAVAALVLALGAGCTPGGAITADSTCGDYLSAQTDARHAAAASLSSDLHAVNGGNPLWGPGLDTECGAAPDATLRTYFAGQLALQTQSVSMEHTINVGDTLLVNTLAYTRAAPRRGDVILFTAPKAWSSDPAETRFVKRIIATGGDHLVCCDPQGRMMVNGRPLDEPYLYRAEGRSDPPSDRPFDIVVPDGRLWVMGDHRSRSGDSLMQYLVVGDIGRATIRLEALVGRAFAVIDPYDHHDVRRLTVPPSYTDIPDPHRS